MAGFNILAQWSGLKPDAQGRVICLSPIHPLTLTGANGYKQLAANPNALAELFVDLTDRIKSACHDFGTVIAVDSTTVPTHANPNRRARLVSDVELAGYAEEDEVERRQAVAAGNGGRWRRRIRPEETSDPEASWYAQEPGQCLRRQAVGVLLQGAHAVRHGNGAADCHCGYDRQSERLAVVAEAD